MEIWAVLQFLLFIYRNSFLCQIFSSFSIDFSLRFGMSGYVNYWSIYRYRSIKVFLNFDLSGPHVTTGCPNRWPAKIVCVCLSRIFLFWKKGQPLVYKKKMRIFAFQTGRVDLLFHWIEIQKPFSPLIETPWRGLYIQINSTGNLVCIYTLKNAAITNDGVTPKHTHTIRCCTCTCCVFCLPFFYIYSFWCCCCCCFLASYPWRSLHLAHLFFPHSYTHEKANHEDTRWGGGCEKSDVVKT